MSNLRISGKYRNEEEEEVEECKVEGEVELMDLEGGSGHRLFFGGERSERQDRMYVRLE